MGRPIHQNAGHDDVNYDDVGYGKHLRRLLLDEIEGWIAWSLPYIVRRSLKNGLRGLWLRGDFASLSRESNILAANHHSWWDGYMIYPLYHRTGRKPTIMMDEAQLARFRFFRHHKVVGHRELKTIRRRLATGDTLLIFPEGKMRPPGQVGDIEPGVAVLAQRAGVPVYPLAIRTVMRGAQHPEVFMVVGERLEPSDNIDRLLADYHDAINALLRDVDRDIRDADPEADPPGYDGFFAGKASFHEQMGWVDKLWNR